MDSHNSCQQVSTLLCSLVSNSSVLISSGAATQHLFLKVVVTLGWSWPEASYCVNDSLYSRWQKQISSSSPRRLFSLPFILQKHVAGSSLRLCVFQRISLFGASYFRWLRGLHKNGLPGPGAFISAANGPSAEKSACSELFLLSQQQVPSQGDVRAQTSPDKRCFNGPANQTQTSY